MQNISGNRLGEAVSPYLLQHKDNPVHWREWSAETLREAQAEDRPILLSVGYAACHWCHVMAHESFEDEATAAVMNRLFVNVKVDREERPDIDHLYMSALHAMGEQGGWPMTMFLTPKGEPFYGGTYFPKRASHGRPGFVELLEAVALAWTERRTKLQGSADALTGHLKQFLSRPAGAPPLDPGALIAAAQHRDHFLTTLTALCEGGIYDHLGGGLHRYSTDDRWLVPHFEKMLYDNAQFLRHLVWGWRATGNDLFRVRIDETVAWLAREMRVEGGGLAASLDADSLDERGNSEEGAFYVWSAAEIDAVIGSDALDFRRRYDVTPNGNWEGKTILNRIGGFGAPGTDFEAERQALLAIREKRPRPGRDDKVLADWNGLAIRALAEVAAVLDHDEALCLAKDAFGFVMERLFRDGRLHHATRDGAVSGSALSSDYGAMCAAAAQLFATTLDPSYLEAGRRLADALEAWHADGEGGHFMTASDASDVMIRLRGDSDDAVPAPTALVLEGLALLAQVGGDAKIADRVDAAAEQAALRIAGSPAAFPGILCALDRLSRASELALVGDASALDELVSVANRSLDLSRVDFRLDDPSQLPAELALSSLALETLPAAILCADQACRPPVFDAPSLERLLAGSLP